MYKGFEEKRKFFPRCSVDIEESDCEVGEVRWRLWERDGLNVFLQDCFWVLTKEGEWPTWCGTPQRGERVRGRESLSVGFGPYCRWRERGGGKKSTRMDSVDLGYVDIG